MSGRVLANHPVIISVLADPIPVDGIALQDTQSPVVATNANGHLVPYTFEPQAGQVRVFAP